MNHIVRNFVFCLTFACMIGASAAASHAAQSITREDIENRRQEIVVAAMKFGDEQQKKKFLEVYVPYQEKLMKIMKGREKLLTQFLEEEKNGAVSDEEASQILGKSLAFAGQRLQAEDDYVRQLKKILPAEQVLRAYQIETKLNALYLAVLFDTVPLARQKATNERGQSHEDQITSPDRPPAGHNRPCRYPVWPGVGAGAKQADAR